MRTVRITTQCDGAEPSVLVVQAISVEAAVRRTISDVTREALDDGWPEGRFTVTYELLKEEKCNG
jgi:hypothetical protein